MRISTSACFAFWDEERVRHIARQFGVATHPDPRCVFCTIAAALLIARYLQAGAGLRAAVDRAAIDATVEEALGLVAEAEEHRAAIEEHCRAESVADLKLSGNAAIGYCLKAFGAGLWAVKFARSFEDGIAQIVREGGDADTNASVAGAMLGAKFGFAGIPQQFVKFMFVGQWLWREMSPYLQLMGLSVPQSPYLK
jgi:ADP-ribosylglycohydrolase